MSFAKALAGAVVVMGLTAGAASALTTTQTQILTTHGQTMTFNFTGLAPSDGSGGTITIASGLATAATPDENGLDLDDSKFEFFDVYFDGVLQGGFNCAGGVATAIAGCTSNGPGDNIFSLALSLSGSALQSLIADGSVAVRLVFSGLVDEFGDGDEVKVSLTYNPVAAVPLPAALPLLASGLGALGFAGWRRRKAAAKAA